MTRRDATPDAPDQRDAPADPAPPEPSDDEQQPDEQRIPSPEGDDSADDEATDRQADQADEGDDDEAGDEDWKAKYETTEQKRRDFESRATKAETAARDLNDYIPKLHAWYRGLIEKDAPELYAKITDAERKRNEGQSSQRAVRGDSYAVINGVYRDGDKPFGDYLTTLVEDAGVTITTQSLAKHKRTYDSIKGGSQNGNGQQATPPRAGSATAAGADSPPRPPRVPAAGRQPTDVGEPPWKPGQPFDVRGNLSKGLRDSANKRSGRR